VIPVQKRLFCHPRFGGSYSIKAVLPAIAPKLTYNNLDVQNGTAASLLYPQLRDINDQG